MEEDTGKSLHVGGATGRIHGAEYSLVDYNRAGIPLIEIVTKPVEGTGARAPEVARAYVTGAARPAARARRLRRPDGAGLAAVRRERLAAADARRRRAAAPAGPRPRTSTRCARWSGPSGTRSTGRPPVLAAGGRVVQETRHWHEDTGVTTSGRSKEEAEDYRYFPEPDLVPIAPVAGVGRASCAPRCPSRRPSAARRLQAEWGFTDLEMRDVVNAGALAPRRGDGRRGRHAAAPPASGGWASSPAAPTATGSTLTDLARSRRSRSAELARARRRRHAQRQAGPAGARGRAAPARARRSEVVAARGLAAWCTTTARSARPSTAPSRPNPAVADKIRDGKVGRGRCADRRGDEGDEGQAGRRAAPAS